MLVVVYGDDWVVVELGLNSLLELGVGQLFWYVEFCVVWLDVSVYWLCMDVCVMQDDVGVLWLVGIVVDVMVMCMVEQVCQ